MNYCYTAQQPGNFCNDLSLRLIEEHTRIIENAPLDRNVIDTIQGPIERSLQQFAPIGSRQYRDLYDCVYFMGLYKLRRWYDQIERFARPSIGSCTPFIINLIQEHEQIDANAPIDQNVFWTVTMPITNSIKEHAPVGTPAFDALYQCAVERQSRILPLYRNIRDQETQ